LAAASETGRDRLRSGFVARRPKSTWAVIDAVRTRPAIRKVEAMFDN
jgi:hypothetical protein